MQEVFFNHKKIAFQKHIVERPVFAGGDKPGHIMLHKTIYSPRSNSGTKLLKNLIQEDG